MLTARDDETDMLVGLAVGADDYLTKPFSHARARRPGPRAAAPGRAAPRQLAGAGRRARSSSATCEIDPGRAAGAAATATRCT